MNNHSKTRDDGPSPTPRRRGFSAIVPAVLLASSCSTCLAADPPRREDETRRVPEVVEMFWSIVTQGARMGPGQGWFHPAQDRYGWSWLAQHCDRDDDGSVTAEEFGGDFADLFARLDRDRSGAVTADDFDWSERSSFLRSRGQARGRFARIDANSNGRISREEWDAFFTQAAQGKKGLTADDLADALYAPPPRPPQEARPPAGEGPPSRLTLLAGLFKGEVGSPCEGPDVGDLAPEFTLQTHDRKREVTLSEFRGHRPVVLIFGSFT